jgi:hypothetical protein
MVPYPASCDQGAVINISPAGVIRIGAVARSHDGGLAAFRVDGVSPGTAEISASIRGKSAGGLVVTVPPPQPG